jgi:hypothetical protein
MARVVRARFDEAEIRAFLNDPAGPVAHLLQELGGRAAAFAKAKVRKKAGYSAGKHGQGGGFPPGYTAATIEDYLHAIGSETPWEELSASGAAKFLESGTKRHPIKALGPYSLSNVATGYFGPLVQHPGARPYPFLMDSLWSLQGQV